MRRFLCLLLIGLVMAACRSTFPGSPTTVRVASPLPVETVDGIAPRPTHLPGSIPGPWSEAIAAQIHANLTAPLPGAVASLPPSIASRFSPFARGVNGLICPRYDVAYATDDPATLVSALRFLLVARSYTLNLNGDVARRLGDEMKYGRRSYFSAELGAWAPERSHSVRADLGEPSLAQSAGFGWADAGGARYLIVLRYEQRCALL